MADKLTTGILWNKAAVSGAIMAAIPTAYLILTYLMSAVGLPSILTVLLTFVLWAAKLAGCLLLMRFFMIRLTMEFEDADNRDTFRYGTMIAALSALVCSAVQLIYAKLNEDTIREAYYSAIESYSSMLDSNSTAMIDSIYSHLPSITFFSNLIYCFIFGLIVSAIFSRNIPSADPFENTNS